MTPDKLTVASFAGLPPLARAFAKEYLPLLQRFPLIICPSFLQQIETLDTSFPAESASLRWQSDAFQQMPASQFDMLTEPLRAISLSTSLKNQDWLGKPAAFVAELAAYLWSSGQMTAFRSAANNLFAAIPPQIDNSHRLVIVVLGQGAQVDGKQVLRKLRKHGVFMTSIQHESAPGDIRKAILEHTGSAPPAYASWYVDGGAPHPTMGGDLAGFQVVSYHALEPVRERVLKRMQENISSPGSGPEHMRDQLAAMTQSGSRAAELTDDEVLQRFYTELFTLSSGPQIFSTSFVQWTGRELARRVKPSTLLLRYAPRQRHHDLNELLPDAAAGGVDVQGSLRDAEMGAFYNWIEMSRISAPGKLTFAVWVEGYPLAVVIGSGSPAGSSSSTPMSLSEALKTFG